ncbi:hypothetical protein BSZ19_46230 [Bradyrhizobium japonicum]|uniref:Uncharacterized protein n=1 Tax=Bradyrhizobium japonicum TaxID=375 RepID=A0A1Y2J7D7_BRAJP|nr:hypothetical protein BSZ19_46230 [Bradyrhizobium japonicum]
MRAITSIIRAVGSRRRRSRCWWRRCGIGSEGRGPPPRHCERSEAIQNLSAEVLWIASLRSQ